MLGEMFSMGLDLVTMPARIGWRGVRALGMTQAELQRFSRELRAASDQATREVRMVLAEVDAEMSAKAAHLSPEEKIQAASLALYAAERHLSMAAVDLLRALWLGSHAARESLEEGGVTIDHEGFTADTRRGR